MAELITQEKIVDDLKAIRKDLDYIKKRMIVIDADTVLTPKEEARLEESLKEHKEGKAVPLEDFEKEMDK